MNNPRHALILTGGGARASYQVGVLKAIAQLYPREHAIPFPVLCGTSAGAINVTALACYASCFSLGVKKLEVVWKNLHADQVFEFSVGTLVKRFLLNLVKAKQTQSFSLMSNEPLRTLLNQVIDYQRIDRNIVYGALDVLAITASSYITGESTTFFQGRSHYDQWRRARRAGRRAVIATNHLLASAALPFIFPPERVAGHFYGDGSVHQLNPLSPAIHFGANRLLIISLDAEEGPSPPAHWEQLTSSDVGGHLLDTIFADAMNTDLERLHRLNQLIGLLPPQQAITQDLEHVDTLMLRPSVNLDTLAMEHLHELPKKIRRALSFLGVEADKDTAIAGFLMFEKNYTKRLIDLGYQDAQRHIEEIREILNHRLD